MAEQNEIHDPPEVKEIGEAKSDAVLIHPDVIEKAASRILDSVENIHAREKLKQYFASDRELENHVEAYRDGLNRMLLQFREEADNSSIGAYGEQLHKDFQVGFDAALLKLFAIIDVKGNPELRNRILANIQIPQLHLLSLDSKSTLGEAVHGAAENIIYINPDADQTYEQFKKTFLHEFLHVYVEDLIGKFIDDDCYPKNVELARSLFALDKDALMDWYAGGSTENFQFRLKEKLTPIYGGKEAQNLVDELFDLFTFALQRKLAAADSALAYLKKANISLGIDKLYDFMFSRISYSQLEKLFISAQLESGRKTLSLIPMFDIENIKFAIYADSNAQYDRLRDKFLFAASSN